MPEATLSKAAKRPIGQSTDMFASHIQKRSHLSPWEKGKEINLPSPFYHTFFSRKCLLRSSDINKSVCYNSVNSS